MVPSAAPRYAPVRILLRLWSIWYFAGFFGLYLAIWPFQAALLATNRSWARRSAHTLNILWGYWVFLWGLCRVRVIRQARLPQGPCIYAANHRSYIDIPAGHVALRRYFRYIAKQELARLPLFGYMYRKLHILLDRSSGGARARSLQRAAAALREDESLFIFPEGTTRHPDAFQLGAFQPGAFALAIKYNIPIVPIALVGTSRMLSNDGKFWLRPFRTITVVIHPPVIPNTLTLPEPEVLSQALKDILQHTLDRYANR
ncbi:MAG: 1-acyl-sn-glycerol-3-phosphate acyltransferase [Bacteroidetes bacterium]|nr:1-acyl-sn-glycerol-3-phosphate acyltransferase [Bacteroidota bacterium]